MSCTDMIYLDFAKAFDKVDHGVLLHKLKQLSITGKLGNWLLSFLSNRNHFVRIPGGVSSDGSVLSGVLQGTVLGPLLFLVLLSDISSDINHSSVVSFADDTRVYRQINEISDCSLLQNAHSSFRWRGARIFNALLPKIRNLSNCDVLLFKRQLDNYLSLLPDVPCTPNTDNSITGAVVEEQSWCLQSGGLAD